MRSVSRGVAIDYFLKQPADAVSIEILDAHGQLIRTFKGVPEEPEDRQPSPRRRAERRRSQRPPPPKVSDQEGSQPVRLGHAVSGRARFQGADLLGGKHPRSGGAAGGVSGAV